MAKIYDGSSYLDSHLGANDYYSEGEVVVGRWIGKGAQLLGLTEGKILPSDAAFEKLRRNLHPQTGKQLTERTSKNRVAFMDFQCSSPKSVSLLAVTFGDDRLRQAHESAADKAFLFLQSFAARRIRQGAAAWSEENRITGNLCAAAFVHDASRALDAQLHTHFVTANATFDNAEGRWCALTEAEILRAIRCCGKVYQATLANAVVAAGYTLEKTHNLKGQVTGFEIAGVTEADREIASRRRAAIIEAIKEFESSRGREPTKQEVDQIVRKTRGDKLTKITTEEVRRLQLAAFTEDRREALRILVEQAKCQHPRASAQISVESALAEVRDHLFERQSVIHAHELIAETLNQNLGILSPDSLVNAVSREQADLRILTRTSIPEVALIATRTGLESEIEALQFVNDGIAAQAPLGPTNFEPPSYLSDGQRTCVLGILGSCNTVTGFRGVAGSGKTTTLKAVESGLKANGVRSIYCAPTASAVEVLKSEGFENARTLSSLLLADEHGDQGNLRNSVIIVDEAGLISTRQGTALFEMTMKADARILLVGDARQHSAVEAGDFLALLETHSNLRSNELSDIRRQTVAAYRAAIQTLARGDTRAGLLALDALGYVHESADDYLTRAAESYLEHRALDVILVAPTWAEIDAVTAVIRDRMQQKGELRDEQEREGYRSKKWTAAQKRNPANYATGQILSVHTSLAGGGLKSGTCLEVVSAASRTLQVRDFSGQLHFLEPARFSQNWDVGDRRILKLCRGDQILIQQNHKPARLTNGDVLRIDAISADGTITASDKIGNSRTIPATFGALTYGYAVTSHKAQGRTADHVVICAARLDSKSTYVAFSRGRKSAVCFTPDKAALVTGLPLKSSARRSALDVLGGLARTRSQHRVHRRRRWRMIDLAMHLARRAVSRVAAATARVFTSPNDAPKLIPSNSLKISTQR